MIAQLSGRILSVAAASFVIEVGGLGLRVLTNPQTSSALHSGEQAQIQTSLIVREDSLTLYGFAAAAQRDAFELVQGASGVGPKIALAVVSVLSPSELGAAISNEDTATLCAVPGIGKKSAQRLILELKDKIEFPHQAATAPTTQPDARWRDAVTDGLQGLGWSAKDAKGACDQVAHLAAEDPDISVARLLRAALQTLAKS
ncbi:MAG: Holliday junction branch migration protein RuvA [Arachnia propionica]|nr:MAG: Holliday junction branch migration protein RuvA [Arachnia propionica]